VFVFTYNNKEGYCGRILIASNVVIEGEEQWKSSKGKWVAVKNPGWA
jgi:hypothetical protein